MRAAIFHEPHRVEAGDRPDGAVGLSGALAAERLGAERIIALSRHADRRAPAHGFGATDIVEQRGDDAIQAVMALTDGVGVDATLECVGTGQAFETALAIARPGAYAAVDERRAIESLVRVGSR